MNKNLHIPPPCPSSTPTESAIPAQIARLSDRDLLDGWRRDGSRAAFDELVRRYRVMVLSICRRHCYQDQDADDAFQTTWVCLAQTASQIRHPERLAGWLHRVATRACQLTLKQRRRLANSSDPRDSSDLIDMNDVPSEDEQALEALSRRHEAIVLDEELSELPEHYRTAIVMHLIEGDSYQNIAERLESTVGAVRGHVQRGKQALAARLRHRGVVPVLAYAAVQLLEVSESVAAEVTSRTIPADWDLSTAPPASSTDPTGPPVNLYSLSKSGSSMLRISSWVVAGCLATAAVGGMCLSQVSALGDNGEKPMTLRMADAGGAANEGPPVVVGQTTSTSPPTEQLPRPATVAPKPIAETPLNSSGYRTKVAKQVAEKMDSQVTLELDLGLESLADALSQQLGVPVLVDVGAFDQANLNPSQTTVAISSGDQPLRSSLRRVLQPLGLRAEVQDEGLVITTDFTELARRGILTDKWVGLSDEFIARVDDVLATSVALPQPGTALESVIAELSLAVDFPIVVNALALEEAGLTVDVPISGHQRSSHSEDLPAESGVETATTSQTKSLMQKLPLGAALNFLLQDLGLTYTLRDGMISITTREQAETRLLTRLYFLEGTGLPRGEFTSAISMIQTTIEPASWESLGGVGTLVPVGDGEYARPALLVGATLSVHEQIADLLQSLRESHIGPDPIWSGRPPTPVAPPANGGMGGGGMF
ncbi:RNA polymerase sigma factor [Allorhodopirellula heiligendammensis]|uniref:ECF RNA polymerase sigma factor SigE n=1 Tax=Allorhodopirellula heiligendammensis TaxID=2714739 RepID=A0A5C6C760_9BACT|nr:sigma-70 family RNA polymerase sigma factor [Allorhodopirellula heiligendammensis]TWU19962.1 ECF RNA polymerase sigma factor SigE [Allorhodopirellula heiligendammensis]